MPSLFFYAYFAILKLWNQVCGVYPGAKGYVLLHRELGEQLAMGAFTYGCD